jgi:DNA helicase HerA-like ATPase
VRLLGSFVVAKTWQAASSRAKLGKPRRDASLYMDEAHNFLTLPYSLEEMLAEARHYHLSLVLAHQNLAQLPADLREGISANARNKVFFTVSPEDAHLLERHTLPHLGAHDLSHLDAFQAAAALVVDAADQPACTLTTRPLPDPVSGRAEAIRTTAHRNAAGPTTVSHAPDHGPKAA